MKFFSKLIAAFSAFVILPTVVISEQRDVSGDVGIEAQRIALVQMRSEILGNCSVVYKWVAEAKAEGTDFVMLPESAYFEWFTRETFIEAAVILFPHGGYSRRSLNDNL